MRARLALLFALSLAACVSPAQKSVDAPALEATKANDGARMVKVRDAWLRVLDLDQREVSNDALPVVFVHGFGSRLESWRMVQPNIAKSHRTISFDQRGFGLSERSEGEYGPESHAADVIALMDALHVERAILVGHSYGCGVVLRAALRHPERVAGIVLVSPFALDEQVGSYFHWAQVPGLGEAMFSAQFTDFPGEKYQLAFGPESRAKFVSVAALDEVQRIQAQPGTTYAALATIRGMDYAKVEKDYAAIRAPITVVWGEKDRVTPIKMLDTLAARLPNAKFVRVPAVGHMPVWENPAAVLDAFANTDAAVAKASSPAPQKSAEAAP
jgi:pimeloyl-ACP methyl ester carboxylesterase